MKIAIPVDTADMCTGVCISFGRAPYFLIYDTDTKESTFIDNAGAASAGGAGIKAAQAIVDQNANILLTPRCGQNAVDVLEAGDIKLYKTVKALAQENIDAFVAGDLSLLEESHPGFHGHGGN
ncbi:MAG TPA: dinitrogenase iron-molybdenum cofactor biosynthesis protein [Epulopiscium sp.]|nr:dinitrogenase iron-molybdenum cofactor biosynthesis protein [Candidatus Epulonipiscium sp.]